MLGAIAKESNPAPYHEYDDDEVAGKESETNLVRGRAETTDYGMDRVDAFSCTVV